MKLSNYLSHVRNALLGRSAGGDPNLANTPQAELAARIAALELDLRDRDERISGMQREYEQLTVAKQRDDAGTKQEEVERLLKRLAGPMSNLLALSALSKTGRDVDVADLLQLVQSLDKELRRAGLEPIGEAGQETTFDVAGHQRLSGGAVHPGSPVVVQIPGFRMGQKVLLKAMVSTKEAEQI